MTDDNPAALEKTGPWEWRKGLWSVRIKFEPSAHAIVEGPSQVLSRGVLISTREMEGICNNTIPIEGWRKFPEYILGDFKDIMCRADKVVKAMEKEEEEK